MPFIISLSKATLAVSAFVRVAALAALICLAWPLAASAQITLILDAPHGLQGTVIEGGLFIETDTPVAGVNAEIILPPGVLADDVQKGALLIPPGDWQLAFAANGQNLRVIAWSATQTFTGEGEVIKLLLALDPALQGLQDLEFASVNPDPLVNSRHAVANADGSVSLPHGVMDGSFLAYSSTSDFDMDGMPDAWEVDNGLDPLADNATQDADGDGYTDLEEYLAGTDPNDPFSNPEILFRDSFEQGP